MEWKPIDTAPMDNHPILVWLSDEHQGSRIHVATFHPNVKCIGGAFEFDVPKATHWTEVPEGPDTSTTWILPSRL